MSKHTPGPWRTNTAGVGSAGGKVEITEIYVYNPDVADDVAIAADIIDPTTCKPSAANARLIAAAPELLDILERAVRRLEIAHANGDSIMREWIVDARAAIAKATWGAALRGERVRQAAGVRQGGVGEVLETIHPS